MSILNEIDRKNMVGKTKSQSPDRYAKRIGYRVNSYSGIDPDRLLEDDLLVAQVKVGDYYCTIAYKGVLENLYDIVRKQPKHNVTLQSVIRAVTKSIDKTDVLVDCTCPDFIYRYSYWASKYGYKYGRQETRPSKITNPDDKMGAMCKHLTMLLSNKKWMVKLSSIVNDFVKANIDKIRDRYNIPEEDFFINVPGRPSVKTGRNTRMTNTSTNRQSQSGSDNDGEE